MSPATRFTVDDYLQLPEDRRAELIEGDLVMVPSPTPAHQAVVARLLRAVVAHLAPSESDRVLAAPLGGGAALARDRLARRRREAPDLRARGREGGLARRPRRAEGRGGRPRPGPDPEL